MASLWTRNPAGELVEEGLETPGPAAVGGPAKPVRLSDGLSLVPVAGLAASWVLVADAGARVTVNSESVPAGIRVLETRDEIRCGACAVVFADERVAHVESFPGETRTVWCARCACAIAGGTPAVRCPACGSWYHEQAPGEFPCWSAIPFCQICGCATTTGGSGWAPEEF